MAKYVSVILIFLAQTVLSQSMIDTSVIKEDSAQFWAYIDSTNLAKVSSIIDKHGWLGKSQIGNRANYTLWLVIQHADLKTQEKYLPLMRASVVRGESGPDNLAYLEDR